MKCGGRDNGVTAYLHAYARAHVRVHMHVHTPWRAVRRRSDGAFAHPVRKICTCIWPDDEEQRRVQSHGRNPSVASCISTPTPTSHFPTAHRRPFRVDVHVLCACGCICMHVCMHMCMCTHLRPLHVLSRVDVAHVHLHHRDVEDRKRVAPVARRR